MAAVAAPSHSEGEHSRGVEDGEVAFAALEGSPAPTTADGSVDPKTLIFREASLAEKHLCWARNSGSWSAPLKSITDYIGRETLNGSQTMTRNGKIRYWVLVDPKASGHVYAAVETLQKEVMVKTKAGGYTEEIGHGIASVFTDPVIRKRGIATVLMQKLGEWLDREGGGRFSALYSDIGKVWYAQRGWRTFPSQQMQINFEAATGSVPADAPAEGEGSGATPLYLEDMEALCERDTEVLRHSIRDEPLADGVDARFSFAPSFAQASWHFATVEYIARIHLGKDQIPRVKGAHAGNCWMYWTHDFRERELNVLRIVTLGGLRDGDSSEAGISEALALIMARAVAEAKQWALHGVIVWAPSEQLVAVTKSLPGVQVTVGERTEGSIPCLRWKGCDIEGKNVDWEANEKFAWC